MGGLRAGACRCTRARVPGRRARDRRRPAVLGLLLEGRDPARGLRAPSTCRATAALWAIGLVDRRRSPRSTCSGSTSGPSSASAARTGATQREHVHEPAPGVLGAARRAGRALGRRAASSGCRRSTATGSASQNSNSLRPLPAPVLPRPSTHESITRTESRWLAGSRSLVGARRHRARAACSTCGAPSVPGAHRARRSRPLYRAARATSTTWTSSTTRVIVRPLVALSRRACSTAASTRA